MLRLSGLPKHLIPATRGRLVQRDVPVARTETPAQPGKTPGNDGGTPVKGAWSPQDSFLERGWECPWRYLRIMINLPAEFNPQSAAVPRCVVEGRLRQPRL